MEKKRAANDRTGAAEEGGGKESGRKEMRCQGKNASQSGCMHRELLNE